MEERTYKGHVVHAWGENRFVVDGWVKMTLPSDFQVPEGTEIEVTIKTTHIPDEHEIREFKRKVNGQAGR